MWLSACLAGALVLAGAAGIGPPAPVLALDQPPSRTCARFASGTVEVTPDSVVRVYNGKRVELDSGDVVIAARQPMTLQYKDGTVTLHQGVIALARYGDGIFQFLVLDDQSLESVSARVSGLPYVLKIGVGQELLVANSKPALDSFAKSDFTGRRREQVECCDDGKIVLLSEFLHVSVMGANEVLRKMRISNSIDDRALFARIEKMAASLDVVTAGHGEYFSFDHSTDENQPVGYSQ